jgi:hypothetical protein
VAELGRWDILVKNAAVAITKPFGEITEADLRGGRTRPGNAGARGERSRA